MKLFNISVLCIAVLVKLVISEKHCKPKVVSISARCVDRRQYCEEIKPCKNGGTCTPTDGEERYKCDCVLGFGGVNCETKLVNLKLEEVKSREAVLSVIKTGAESLWAAYVVELINLRTEKPLEFHKASPPGADITKITLRPLDPGTSYSVRVRPVQNYEEPENWIDETLFDTPVELKVEEIEERRAVLSVMTSNSTLWAGYDIELTNRKKLTTTPQFHGVAQPGNVTKVNLSSLDPKTEYKVRVTPTKDDKQLEKWSNEILFKTEKYHFSRSDSVILSGHPDYEQKLNAYLEPVQVSGKQWKLCYRASEHNYRSAAFHTSCDNKGATITLVRVGIYVFGGYADKSWDAPSDGSWKGTYSDKAFLFSLKNHLNEQFKMFTYREREYAMYSRNSWGPDFGWGDLHIANRCDVNTDSYSNLGFTYKPPNGYTWGSPEARKLLAGSFNFKCDEYEVFYQK